MCPPRLSGLARPDSTSATISSTELWLYSTSATISSERQSVAYRVNETGCNAWHSSTGDSDSQSDPMVSHGNHHGSSFLDPGTIDSPTILIGSTASQGFLSKNFIFNELGTCHLFLSQCSLDAKLYSFPLN